MAETIRLKFLELETKHPDAEGFDVARVKYIKQINVNLDLFKIIYTEATKPQTITKANEAGVVQLDNWKIKEIQN